VETVMRRITILAAAAMICAGACDTLAHFHSNCHTAPYGSCNSAHFDDHQLHDDLQFAGRQLSNSLSCVGRIARRLRGGMPDPTTDTTYKRLLSVLGDEMAAIEESPSKKAIEMLRRAVLNTGLDG
jgi:hypothetical protein